MCADASEKAGRIDALTRGTPTSATCRSSRDQGGRSRTEKEELKGRRAGPARPMVLLLQSGSRRSGRWAEMPLCAPLVVHVEEHSS